ncbi:Panacea domain-containing protein [Photobacterium sp. SP02]|uniref:Panacea domain-containing protein n=1 Tax=Photobacterium sp. SP02 TaxID=3032280 RepID=UPI003145390F
MKKLQRIIAFLCLEYPHKSEITKARLTKMVYLADWFSALIDGKQLTKIEWVFNHYGPYVDDVVEAAHSALGFKIEHQNTMYGTSKYVISYKGDIEDLDLKEREKEILTAVILKTKSMYFNEFVDYVYSTYPVKTKERYSSFNLVRLAEKYKKESANAARQSDA